MIHIVEGVPGSGKTYYAVKYLLDNFYTYDDFYNEYKEKENKNVLVISNIEDLKVKHLKLDYLIERFTLEKFFTIQNFETIQKQYKVKNIVLIIDEAQRYFDRKFFNKEVFYFFQYHRHLGVDIFLITQNKNTISREIVVLAEFIVKAQPRSTQPGVFLYRFYDVEGFELYKKTLKRDKKVFSAYSSMKFEEVNKPKNIFLSKIAVSVAVLMFSVAAIFGVLHWWSSQYVSKAKTNEPEKISKVENSSGTPGTFQEEKQTSKLNKNVVEDAKVKNVVEDAKVKLNKYIQEWKRKKVVADNPEYRMILVDEPSSPNWICSYDLSTHKRQCFDIYEK